jgi:hypothetical protein
VLAWSLKCDRLYRRRCAQQRTGECRLKLHRAWVLTFPVIHQSIRKARAQLYAGHEDIRAYFSDTTVVETTTNATPNVPRAPTTTIVYTNSCLLAFLQRFQMRRDQRSVIEDVPPMGNYEYADHEPTCEERISMPFPRLV